MGTTTKEELANTIAERLKEKQVLVRDIVQAFLDECIEELKRGNRLEFRDFGVFETVSRTARKARNPKTGDVVQVPPRIVVDFKMGKRIKALVNLEPYEPEPRDEDTEKATQRSANLESADRDQGEERESAGVRTARLPGQRARSQVSWPRMTWDEYSRLAQEERDRLDIEVYQANEAWIAEILNQLAAEWILVMRGRVRRFSPTLDDYPSGEVVTRLAVEENEVPFVFVRNAVIEEAEWSHLPHRDEGDYYPTLPLAVAGQPVVADLDTGSPCTFLDHNGVLRAGFGLDPSTRLQTGRHIGSDYRYRIFRVPLSVRGDDGEEASDEIQCRCVLDWPSSPLCSPLTNPNRKALAGRDLLLRLELIVELDGRQHKTRVRLSQANR